LLSHRPRKKAERLYREFCFENGWIFSAIQDGLIDKDREGCGVDEDSLFLQKSPIMVS